MDPCPMAQPNGGACSAPEGFRCSYGSSVRTDCRSAVVCKSGQWTGEMSACSQSTGCPKPSTLPSGQCTGNDGAFCTYGDTVCGCGACLLSGPCMAPPLKWQCIGPPTGPGCPAVAPNDGTPCNHPGAQCSYGFVCSGAGAQVECKNGLWYWSPVTSCLG